MRVFPGYHGSGHSKSRAEFNQEGTPNCKLERGMSLMECSGGTEKPWILVNIGNPSLVSFASNALIYGSVGGGEKHDMWQNSVHVLYILNTITHIA